MNPLPNLRFAVLVLAAPVRLTLFCLTAYVRLVQAGLEPRYERVSLEARCGPLTATASPPTRLIEA